MQPSLRFDIYQSFIGAYSLEEHLEWESRSYTYYEMLKVGGAGTTRSLVGGVGGEAGGCIWVGPVAFDGDAVVGLPGVVLRLVGTAAVCPASTRCS